MWIINNISYTRLAGKSDRNLPKSEENLNNKDMIMAKLFTYSLNGKNSFNQKYLYKIMKEKSKALEFNLKQKKSKWILTLLSFK